MKWLFVNGLQAVNKSNNYYNYGVLSCAFGFIFRNEMLFIFIVSILLLSLNIGLDFWATSVLKKFKKI